MVRQSWASNEGDEDTMASFCFNWQVSGSNTIEAPTLHEARVIFNKLTMGETYEQADQTDFTIDTVTDKNGNDVED